MKPLTLTLLSFLTAFTAFSKGFIVPADTSRFEYPVLSIAKNKILVDVKSLSAVSNNVMEMVEKIPGVFVDTQGNIRMYLSTARIYINSQEQFWNRVDLGIVLRALPAQSVYHIEVINQPSAVYDGINDGGIINIILNNDYEIPNSGTASVALIKASQRNLMTTGSFQQMKNNTSFFINATHYGTTDSPTLWFYPNSPLNPEGRMTKDTEKSKKVGLNYLVSQKIKNGWYIEYLGRYLNDRLYKANTYHEDVNGIQTPRTPTTGTTKRNILTQSLRSVWRLDERGSQVNIAFTGDIIRPNEESLNSSPIFMNGEVFGKSEYFTRTFHKSFYYTASSNLFYNLGSGLKLSSGLKYASSKLIYDYSRTYTSQTPLTFHQTHNSNFYNDFSNVAAGYLQGEKEIAGFDLKAGIRVEHTHLRNENLKIFSYKTFDFLPFVFVGKQLFKIKNTVISTNLIYKKSIRRPNPDNLYLRQFNESLGGLEQLDLPLQNNFEGNLNLNDFPFLTAGFRRNLGDLSRSQEAGRYIIKNVYNHNASYYRVLSPIPNGRVFSTAFGVQLQVYHGEDNAKLNAYEWTAFYFLQAKLDTKSTITLNGTYNYIPTNKLYNYGLVALSVNRLFYQDKLQVLLNVSLPVYSKKKEILYREIDQSNEIIYSGKISLFNELSLQTGLSVRYKL